MKTIDEKLASLNATSVWYFAKQDTNFDNAFKAVQIVDELGQQWQNFGTTAWTDLAKNKGLDSNHRILSVAQLLGLLTKSNPFGKSQYKYEYPTPVFREINKYTIGSPEYNALKTEQLLKLRMGAITDTRPESAEYNISPVLFTYEVFWRLRAKGITEMSLGDFYTYVMTCKTHDEIDECVTYLLDPNRKESQYVATYKNDSRVVTLIQNNLNLIQFTNTNVSINQNFIDYFNYFFNGAYTSFVNMMKLIVTDVQMYQKVLTNPIGLSVNFLDTSSKMDFGTTRVNLDTRGTTNAIQTIFYGAPGTGKSHKIEECTNDDNRIRTTFHPDSDYSTFVGAYKPTMEETGVTVAGKKETRIAYKYVPQAFLKAYVNAWKRINDGNNTPYYLVIEEINRGNCAQIFGDLFQLLDRGECGESKYAIWPDDDIRRYLAEQFNSATNIPDAIKSGNEMRLPSNLYIWATMNTSDQSLFPIDSAFKRRWDWEYMPIEKGDRDFVIEIGSKKYDWWNFISIINSKIDEITGSEDKKLGYWFAKPAGNGTIINCNQFVSKVLFYLWNDVYKDYADDNRSIFRITVGNNSKKVAFTDFFGAGRKMKLYAFMQANGVNSISSISVNSQDENLVDDESNIPLSQRDYSKYSINGDGAYGKGELVRRVIELYCEQQSNSSVYEIQAFWMGLNTGIVHLVETQSEFDIRTKNSTDVNKRAKELKLKNGEIIYVSTQVGSGNIMTFINAVNAADIGFSIAKV